MSSAAGQKPVRKFPPPCWTRDEALVLIEAYRERWHALNRAFLRTTDWDAVAETVTTSFPDVTPPKTSAQCRHKMEKLRQRHRVEKQRAAAFSGESFFSTWFYYEAMEAVENGSNTLPDNNPGHEIRVKPLPIQNSTKRRSKPNPNVSIRYQGNEYEDRSLVEAPIEETLIPIAYRASRNLNFNNHLGETLIRQPKSYKPEESGRTGLRPRKFSKVVVNDDEYEESSERWMKVPKVPNNINLLRAKWGNEKKAKAKSKSKSKGKGNNNNNNNNGGVADVVRSIKLLGDGFMKVEKMKMDAVREIEEMRMETEMKRNELMMESQKRIVDAFVKGLIEARKVSTTTMGNM